MRTYSRRQEEPHSGQNIKFRLSKAPFQMGHVHSSPWALGKCWLRECRSDARMGIF